MMPMYDDIVRSPHEADPPKDWRFGASQLSPWLFIGGQEDVCQVLHHVDVWFDFRHVLPTNRKIYLPPHVAYYRMPFPDGDIQSLYEILPKIDATLKAQQQKVLVSCHAGVSRSAVVALYLLCKENGDFAKSWETIVKARPYVLPHDHFQPFIRHLKQSFAK
jgi:protein-tyrosine phosphatase